MLVIFVLVWVRVETRLAESHPNRLRDILFTGPTCCAIWAKSRLTTLRIEVDPVNAVLKRGPFRGPCDVVKMAAAFVSWALLWRAWGGREAFRHIGTGKSAMIIGLSHVKLSYNGLTFLVKRDVPTILKQRNGDYTAIWFTISALTVPSFGA